MNPKSGSRIFVKCDFNFLIQVLIANFSGGEAQDDSARASGLPQHYIKGDPVCPENKYDLSLLPVPAHILLSEASSTTS